MKKNVSAGTIEIPNPPELGNKIKYTLIKTSEAGTKYTLKQSDSMFELTINRGSHAIKFHYYVDQKILFENGKLVKDPITSEFNRALTLIRSHLDQNRGEIKEVK